MRNIEFLAEYYTALHILTPKKTLIKESILISCILFSALSLPSCSTYSSKFTCGESRGAPCLMLRNIDRQIDSGEIEKVYIKCKNKTCTKEEINAGIFESGGINSEIDPKIAPIKAKLKLGQDIDEVTIEGVYRSDHGDSKERAHYEK